jgi:calcineurin-like phosphoesterase family protein
MFFTSDHHFNHTNIIRHSNRPFSSLEEMHEQLVSRWNSAVSPRDVVYHLGDFALSWGKKHDGVVEELLRVCNGRKTLIVGNHDKKAVLRSNLWEAVVPYHELKIGLGGVHKQRIVMCHYALRTWNQMHRGAWMLHGHSHGSLTDVGGKTLDVGVDCHNYTPISLEYVREYMSHRQIVSFDHHVGE